MAYLDSRFGAPFGMVVAVIFAWATYSAFPPSVVLGWLALTLGCNTLRLITRWQYLRQTIPLEDTQRWANWFTVVSAASGLSWGVGAWLFYTPQESIYRVMVVLVLAGMTTGASRLLAPIAAANLLYVYIAICPLLVRMMVTPSLSGRVLVVEDDAVNRQVIDLFLKKMSLTPTFAPDGEIAIAKATSETFDVVLMDCQLPGIDGMEATRQIRQKLDGKPLKIIALTANASTHVREACLAAGMDDFLSKPVRFELLAEVLSRNLAAAPAK